MGQWQEGKKWALDGAMENIKATGRVTVQLDISAQQLKVYYRGAAQDVVTRSVSGKIVRFPCRLLRPFVTSAGVRGRFTIRFDSGGRFQSIEQIS